LGKTAHDPAVSHRRGGANGEPVKAGAEGKMPDLLAAALAAGCDVFLTNDEALERVIEQY